MEVSNYSITEILQDIFFFAQWENKKLLLGTT